MVLYALYYTGYGLSLSTLMTSGLTALNNKEQAQGNAIFNTLQQFSGALGTAIAGVLIAIGQKTKFMSYSMATALGIKWLFIVLCFLMVIALISSLIFVPKK